MVKKIDKIKLLSNTAHGKIWESETIIKHIKLKMSITDPTETVIEHTLDGKAVPVLHVAYTVILKAIPGNVV